MRHHPAGSAVTQMELLVAFALVLATTAIHISLTSHFIVWPDEPGYTDPAASFYLGQGFTSGAWYAQDHNAFWAGNVPLYQFLLIVVYSVFGFSLEATRVPSFIMTGAACFLLWFAFRKTGIVQKRWIGFLMLASLLLAEGTMYASHLGRPDGLAFLLLASGVAAILVFERNARLIAILVISALLPWTGLQVVVAAGILVAAALITLRKRFICEALASLAGVTLGVSLLMLFYWKNGVLADFAASVLPHTGYAEKSAYALTGFYKDRSLLLIAVASLWACVVSLRGWRSIANAEKLYVYWLVVVVFFTPVALLLMGKFSMHYTWIPLAGGIVLLAAWMSKVHLGKTSLVVITVIICLSALAGVPRKIIVALLNPGAVHHQQVAQFVQDRIRPGEFIFYSAPTYYAVKPIADRAFYSNWYVLAITPAEAEKVSVLLIEPRQLDRVVNAVGGSWKIVGEPLELVVPREPLPPIKTSIAEYRRQD